MKKETCPLISGSWRFGKLLIQTRHCRESANKLREPSSGIHVIQGKSAYNFPVTIISRKVNLHFKVGSSFGEVPVPVPVQGFLHGWKEGSDRVSSPGWEPVESLQDGNEKGEGLPAAGHSLCSHVYLDREKIYNQLNQCQIITGNQSFNLQYNSVTKIRKIRQFENFRWKQRDRAPAAFSNSFFIMFYTRALSVAKTSQGIYTPVPDTGYSKIQGNNSYFNSVTWYHLTSIIKNVLLQRKCGKDYQ